jgi:xanthine dehydrogenase accessory factor
VHRAFFYTGTNPAMQALVQLLVDAIRAGRPLAYCRLVETRGSTPQKAGAMMLVYPDGSQAGTLGGGCVEAEVKRRALAALADGRAEIARFNLDSDYGWDDGLICGGRMQVLLEPVGHNGPSPYFEKLAAFASNGAGCTEAIVFDADASGLEPTASFLFDDESRLVAALRADRETASVSETVQRHMQPVHERPRPYAAGGIAFLPLLPRCRLLIVGGGHVGKAVAELAADLDFDVWVADDRPEYVSTDRFPRAQQRIAGNLAEVLPAVDVSPNTYCLIVTRGHNHDEEALYHLVNRGARYVGLIGSRRKIKLIFDDLLNEGVSAEELAKVYAPLGIDIGSQTVTEIAVSICAELVAHRNRGGVVPGRPAGVSPRA